MRQAPTKKSPADYGPKQAPERLGLDPWEWQRALRDGLIPAADIGGSRWSAGVILDALDRIEEIRRRTAGLPDCGASRAAEILGERFGLEVFSGAVVELCRMGRIAHVGEYKNRWLYDGRELATFADKAALETAMVNGRLHMRDQAADVLEIRVSDFDHLVRAGRIAPADWAKNRHHGRSLIPLYRHGALVELLADSGIDWSAVRATPAGRRSPLAALPDRTRTAG